MIRTFVFAAAVSLLAACATAPPPYIASTGANAAGYSEQRIESNRYYVTYRARGEADAQLIQDYALLRAADLTLQNGREWFWVDHRSLDEGDGYNSGPRIGVGIGGGSWGSRSGGSVGVGMSFPLGQRGQTAHAATLEIRFGDGPKPDAENAYDARSISTNLRSRMTP